MTAEAIKSPESLLADQMYPPATDDTIVEDGSTETIVDDKEVPADETVVEDQVTDGEEKETPSEEPNDDAETVELHSVEQLAEHFELDPEWLQNLTISQQVNGEKVDVPLAEALTTHRKVASGDSYLADAKEKAKAILEDANNDKSQFADSVATFGALIKSLEDEIAADVNGIDWKALRKDDPSEYSAKKEDVRDRRERLDKLKKDAVANYKSAMASVAEKQQKARLERLPQEQEVLLARIPEWQDDQKAETERAAVVQYLSTDGFSQDDIALAAYDGKLLALAVKAMRYDQSKKKSEATKKKVTRIPKVLKPGTKKAEEKPTPAPDDRASILYG